MSSTQASLAPATPEFPQTTGEHWIDRLNDGTHILIRPLEPKDREREFDFITRLSPESRQMRFLGTMNEPSKALLDQLMDVDYAQRMAYVALVHKDGQLIEIGISRYAATDGDGQCEFAVVIADDWQRRGLGKLLMQHLIDAAKRNGLKEMISIDSSSNTHVRRLAKGLGFECCADPTDATQIIHTIKL